MKKLFFAIFFILSLSSTFAQSRYTENSLIIHEGSLLGLYDYKLYNGTKLSFNEVNKLVGRVPENIPVMQTSNIWRGITFGLLGVAGAAVVTEIVGLETDKEWVQDTGIITFLASIPCFCTTALISEGYRAKAVENYNLYIMGIPVPTK